MVGLKIFAVPDKKPATDANLLNKTNSQVLGVIQIVADNGSEHLRKVSRDL